MDLFICGDAMVFLAPSGKQYLNDRYNNDRDETSTIADARHQEENPMRKKCLKAIVQEGHNICTSEWQMLGAILKANTV